MATPIRSFKMPDGREFEVFGKVYYGICTTAANTSAKTVSISGFTSESLVAGVRVIVRFQNAQNYNGTPSLNVSGTGAKTIWRNGGESNAGQYEWEAYAVISFIYSGSSWYIENNSHATTTYWGKTKLTNSISNDTTMALTPKAVYDAGYLTAEDMDQIVVGVSGVKGNSESTYRTGNVNLTAADIGAVATTGNETVAGNKNFTGDTTLSSLTLGSESAITSWSGFTRQTATTTWTVPTVENNSATIRPTDNKSGFYQEGKHTYVQLELRLTQTLNADTSLSGFLSGFPIPAKTYAILSVATGGGAYGWASITTSGVMNLRLNKQTGTTTTIYITGTYTTA